MNFLLFTAHCLLFTFPVDDTGMCTVLIPGGHEVAVRDLDTGQSTTPITYPGGYKNLVPLGNSPPRASYNLELTFGHSTISAPVDTYTFAIVPAKDPPYVPTEGETLAAMGFDPATATKEQRETATLSLRSPDDGFNSVRLEQAEGAYVEGVIRFELASSPMAVASRRNRAP